LAISAVKKKDKPLGAKGKGRVAVAMSGGVDSSTAAALLKNDGYEVIGLTMRLWDQRLDEQEDIAHLQDARRVADQIGIPHYVVNLRQAFEQEVVNYFVEEYISGRTPNPCIRCNDRIKFGLLLRKAEELGAKALATGHYARIELNPWEKRYVLRRGQDPDKDQSYFLFTLTQDQMARVLFPLGEKAKAEVRQQALQLGLRVARKKESQEICFIPDDNYSRFMEERKGKDIFRPGEIVDRKGKVLGFHRGLPAYTIGQRRGLGIGSSHPHYVLALNIEKNQVVAGGKEELLANGLIAGNVNWISFPTLQKKMEAWVQIRYRHAGTLATISPGEDEKVIVDLKIPQKAITPGQAVVFYQGDEVLGGGWIEKAF
jgi:tRNA-specific 2-thiouridylase